MCDLSWSLLRIILRGWIISSKINSIKDEDKLDYFVSVMGPMLNTTLKELLDPKLVNAVGYGETIKALSTHFKPQVNITYERFLFN